MICVYIYIYVYIYISYIVLCFGFLLLYLRNRHIHLYYKSIYISILKHLKKHDKGLSVSNYSIEGAIQNPPRNMHNGHQASVRDCSLWLILQKKDTVWSLSSLAGMCK